MSDGWWEASDGEWYPPELHPDRSASVPVPDYDDPDWTGPVPAFDRPQHMRGRPFYLELWFLLGGAIAVVALVLLVVVTAGGGKPDKVAVKTPNGTTTTSSFLITSS